MWLYMSAKNSGHLEEQQRLLTAEPFFQAYWHMLLILVFLKQRQAVHGQPVLNSKFQDSQGWYSETLSQDIQREEREGRGEETERKRPSLLGLEMWLNSTMCIQQAQSPGFNPSTGRKELKTHWHVVQTTFSFTVQPRLTLNSCLSCSGISSMDCHVQQGRS